MAQASKIEWTDVTWNPVAGCTIESAGCSNCYAMRMAARLAAIGSKKYIGLTRKSGTRAVWTGKVALDVKSLSAPYKWRKPRKVFVNSMSDLFHPSVPDEFIARVWRVMTETPRHTYQVLTKRPHRMRELLAAFSSAPNIWIGTSVEDAAVLHRIESLRAIPGFIRFISFEPLIGPVGAVNLTDIDWAIVGGESGPKSRLMEREWVHEIENRCRAYRFRSKSQYSIVRNMSLVGRAELQLDLVPTFRLNVLQQEIETTGSRLNSFLVTEY